MIRKPLCGRDLLLAIPVAMLLGVGMVVGGNVLAEDAPAPTPDPATDFMMASVRGYAARLSPARGPERDLKLVSRPILKWTNPVSGIEHGRLILWTDEDRPAVFAQIFKLPPPENLWLHECQSVAQDPLTFSLSAKLVWSPNRGGAQFTVLTGEDAPPEKPAALLSRARAIARSFATSEDFRTSPGDPPTKFELRLVPQPVYQYTSDKLGVRSGTVFAFVNGTDPEVLLVLEAYDQLPAEKSTGAAGKPTGWRYLLCPMTCWKVAASRDGAEIWSVEEQLGKTGKQDPYLTWRVDSSLLTNDPTAGK